MTPHPATPEATRPPAVPRPRRQVGRPRDPSRGALALEAARALVRERGLEALSLLAVAERSGVNRATVRLRWPDIEELAAAALSELVEGSHTPLPDTGDLRGDLLILVQDEYRRIGAPAVAQLAVQAAGARLRHPRAAAVWQRGVVGRIEAGTRAAVERARGRGDVGAGADAALAAEMLAGPLVVRLLTGSGEIDDTAAERVVDMVVVGLTG